MSDFEIPKPSKDVQRVMEAVAKIPAIGAPFMSGPAGRTLGSVLNADLIEQIAEVALVEARRALEEE